MTDERIYPELEQADWEALLTRALTVVTESSGGTLSSFTEDSPVTALMEGAIWIAEDFTYRLNQLPVAIIRQWLQFWGASATLGSPASGTVTVYLGSPPMETLTIPTGTVFYADNIPFVLTEPLTYPPFTNVATGRVVSQSVGSSNNLIVNAVNAIDGSSPFYGLVSRVASSSMNGGVDASDSDEELIRTLGNLTASRTIVSKADYEAAFQSLVPGSRVVVVPNMLSDGETVDAPGNVHCFVLMPGYRGVTDSEAPAIKSLIESRNTIGTQVHVSGVELLELFVRVNVSLDVDGNPDLVYGRIRDAVRGYVDPYTFDGSAVLYKELEYHARVPGVKYVGGAYMVDISDGTTGGSDEAVNIPLSHPRMLPMLAVLEVNIITPGGINLNYGDTFIPDEIEDTQLFDIEQDLIDEFGPPP